jgi:hypothetical protein
MNFVLMMEVYMDISFSEAKGMFGTAIELMKKGSQLDAQAQIQKLQEQYLELHAENLELKQRLLEIENFAKEDESMVYEEPFFYLVEGDEKEGPFCPKCWQKDHKNAGLKIYRIVTIAHLYVGSVVKVLGWESHISQFPLLGAVGDLTTTNGVRVIENGINGVRPYV